MQFYYWATAPAGTGKTPGKSRKITGKKIDDPSDFSAIFICLHRSWSNLLQCMELIVKMIPFRWTGPMLFFFGIFALGECKKQVNPGHPCAYHNKTMWGPTGISCNLQNEDTCKTK
jgi:hypothetical protein